MKAFDNIKKTLGDMAESSGVGAKVSADNPDVKKLCSYGQEIISEAYRTKDTKNRRYNQHDAYGYAVYYDGYEIPDTRGYLGGEMSKGAVRLNGEELRGRSEVDRFLDSYVAPTGRKLTLLVVNAMFYSQMQENGVAPLTTKYRILSQMISKLNDISIQMHGSVRLVNMKEG